MERWREREMERERERFSPSRDEAGRRSGKQPVSPMNCNGSCVL